MLSCAFMRVRGLGLGTTQGENMGNNYGKGAWFALLFVRNARWRRVAGKEKGGARVGRRRRLKYDPETTCVDRMRVTHVCETKVQSSESSVEVADRMRRMDLICSSPGQHLPNNPVASNRRSPNNPGFSAYMMEYDLQHELRNHQV